MFMPETKAGAERTASKALVCADVVEEQRVNMATAVAPRRGGAAEARRAASDQVPKAMGREAESPWQMPLKAWKQVAIRTWRESSNDNVGLIAAGVAFYGFLALVPLLGAIVLTYGLVAEPETVIRNMQALTAVMPREAASLIGEQLMNVVQTSGGKKGFGLLLALALALFGARNGAGAIITALNIAYEEEESRGFIRVNLLALGMTAAAVLVAILALVAVTALGYLHELFPGTPAFLLALGKIVTYVLLTLAGAAAAATLYRYGPSRQKARWAWLTPGSVLAAVLWVLLTLAFGIYVANFGNYDATYGSLGAVVVLLTWMYLSSYILLFGAELNSELEHQTAKDTTSGAPLPMGERGAWVADHIPEEPSPEASGSPDRSPAEVKAEGPATKVLVGQVESPDGSASTANKGNWSRSRFDPTGNQSSGGCGEERPASPGTDYVAARATSRLGRLAGFRKVGMLSSALTTFGLALIRRRGKAPQGAMLLATAASFAWLSRDDE